MKVSSQEKKNMDVSIDDPSFVHFTRFINVAKRHRSDSFNRTINCQVAYE